MLLPASFALLSFSMLTPPWSHLRGHTSVEFFSLYDLAVSSLSLGGSSVLSWLTNACGRLAVDQKFLGWFT